MRLSVTGAQAAQRKRSLQREELRRADPAGETGGEEPRTDALDRFGTRLEKRFTRAEVALMMQSAGLSEIRFSDAPPYWCAVGFRSS